MITIKYEDLYKNEAMEQGLIKLDKMSGLPMLTAARISKIAGKILREFNQFRAVYSDLAHKYAKHTTEGLLALDTNDRLTFETLEKKKEYEENITKVMGTEIHVRAYRVKLSEIGPCGLSPAEIRGLDFFIENDLEGGTEDGEEKSKKVSEEKSEDSQEDCEEKSSQAS